MKQETIGWHHLDHMQVTSTDNIARVSQKSRPLCLKAHIFGLYLQNVGTNFHDFWHTSASVYSEHIHLFPIPEIHTKWRHLVKVSN